MYEHLLSVSSCTIQVIRITPNNEVHYGIWSVSISKGGDNIRFEIKTHLLWVRKTKCLHWKFGSQDTVLTLFLSTN